MLTAYFYNKNTWLPLTDPTVTVYVTLANLTNDSKVLDNVVMTQSTSLPWAYYFNYTLDTGIDYMSYYSCSNSSYVPQIEKDFHRQVYAGQSQSSAYDFNAQDRKNIQDVLEKYKNIENLLERYFNETNSHIDLAKEQINDKIESIPEVKLEEVEAKKALKLIQNVDKKLSSYIESEMEEKEEIGAIAREITKRELEDEKSMIEKKKEEEEKRKMEEEEQKKEEARIAELLNAEFDKLEEEEKEGKRKELEKELEETLKEAEEIKKELKTL